MIHVTWYDLRPSIFLHVPARVRVSPIIQVVKLGLCEQIHKPLPLVPLLVRHRHVRRSTDYWVPKSSPSQFFLSY